MVVDDGCEHFVLSVLFGWCMLTSINELSLSRRYSSHCNVNSEIFCDSSVATASHHVYKLWHRGAQSGLIN